MGITQHAFGADKVRDDRSTWRSRRGCVGTRPATALMPIRGHSGVQGGAEMGGYATAFPGGAAVDPENAAKLSSQWGFEVPASPAWSPRR